MIISRALVYFIFIINAVIVFSVILYLYRFDFYYIFQRSLAKSRNWIGI